jgi:uncharacterized membrane protein YgcG
VLIFGDMTRVLPPALAKTAAIALPLTAMLLSTLAIAGEAQFRDSAELLAPLERQIVANHAADYPFDVRVLTTSDYPSTDQFESYVRSQLNGSNVVIVGIDPTHRRTAVYCGASTRIEASRCKTAGEAARPYFRDARWGAGIEAALERANAAVGTAPGSPPAFNNASEAASRRMSGGWVFGFVLLGALGLIVIVAILAAVFRSKQPTASDGMRLPGQARSNPL